MDTPGLTSAKSISSTTLHADLLNRARLLLADLTAFQAFLQSQHKDSEIEMRPFKSGVQSEAKSLERISGGLSTTDTSDTTNGHGETAGQSLDEDLELKRLHVLRSSNLPFYEAVWGAAKKCHGVRALSKKMHWSIEPRQYGVTSAAAFTIRKKTFRSAEDGIKVPKKKNILVDIIADNGAEWVKVSTITEKRLLFEMAKEGWEGFSDDSDDSDPASDSRSGRPDDFKFSDRNSGLELVRLAEEMKDAARAIRVQYRHPQIRLVLPKIREGIVKEVDAVICDLRATGAIVECAGEHSRTSCSQVPFPERLTTSFSRMLPTPVPPLTTALNLDCTILLALISDISHLLQGDLHPPPHGAYHSAIVRQIDSEIALPLLVRELYPVILGRELRCTHHAARRMREIVETMGTSAERSRAAIFFSEASFSCRTAAELRLALKSFSAHPVPENLQLPVAEVLFDATNILSDSDPSTKNKLARALPVEAACKVVQEMKLSEINRSVFLYGWDREIVTVTSNRVVAVGIEKSVGSILDRAEEETELVGEEFLGPDIWICGTARSLIGKDKGKREG